MCFSYSWWKSFHLKNYFRVTLEASHCSLTIVGILYSLLKLQSSVNADISGNPRLRAGRAPGVVIWPLHVTVRCPAFQQLIQASSTGHTVSVLNPRPCSFACIRLILEYLRLSDFLPKKWLSTYFACELPKKRSFWSECVCVKLSKRGVWPFFLLGVGKKAVLRRPRNVNMLLIRWRKVDHIGTMSVCQLHKSCSTCMCKGGVAARCLGSLWTPPFLLPIISIRTHSVVS